MKKSATATMTTDIGRFIFIMTMIIVVLCCDILLISTTTTTTMTSTSAFTMNPPQQKHSYCQQHKNGRQSFTLPSASSGATRSYTRQQQQQQYPRQSLLLLKAMVPSTTDHHDHQHQQQENHKSNKEEKIINLLIQKFTTSIVLVLTLLVYHPNEANAGFGPTGGATTSVTPGLSDVTNVQDISVKKLQQLIDGSIDERRLDDLQFQLTNLIDGISSSLSSKQDDIDASTAATTTAKKEQRSSNSIEELVTNKNNNNNGDSMTTTTTTTTTIDDDDDDTMIWNTINERLEKAKLLQTQIIQRENLLNSLQLQPLWFNYLAAFCGSCISTLIMHPIDTIKTRLQVSSTSTSTSTSSESSLKYEDEESEELPFNVTTFAKEIGKGRGDESKVVVTNPKFDNLYEGLIGNLAKEGPPSALYLGVYETVKSYFLNQQPINSILYIWSHTHLLVVYLIAGATGELIGSTIRAPTEAIKVTLQTSLSSSSTTSLSLSSTNNSNDDDITTTSSSSSTSSSSTTTWQAIENVLLTNSGRENILRAWSASICRDVPFGAIQLAIFEFIKAYILNNPDIEFDSNTLFVEAIIGAIAGGIGSFITTPTDVITTRIITQVQQKPPPPPPTKKNHDTTEGSGPLNVISMAQLIYNEGGIVAFFTGWKARVFYWAPAISLFLTCYCSIRQLGVQEEWFVS